MSDKRRLSTSAEAQQHPEPKQPDLLQPRTPKSRPSSSRGVRKRKRHFDPTEKLPTPPPDPHQDPDKTSGERSPKRKPLESKENERPPSGYEEAFVASDGAFQHLDRLHALVAEILELRNRNALLFRHVRELERLRASRRLEVSTERSFYQSGVEPWLPDEDTGFAESLLSAMLEQSSSSSASLQQPSTVPATPSHEVARARSFRAPMARQRSRSIGTEANRPLLGGGSTKRSSCHLQPGKRNSLALYGTAPPKVSKWTKVKAAFKWERAGIGAGGSTNALGNVVLEAMDQDGARFLRLPEPGEAGTTATTPTGSSPRTAEHSGPPSPGTLSSSSSTDDVYSGLRKRTHASRATTRDTEDDPGPRNRSLDSELIIPHNIQYASQHSRDGVSRRLEKGHKTPWGMVKDIIQSRRENVRRPVPRGSLRSEDGYSLSSLESSDMPHEIFISEHSSSGGSKPRVQTTTSEGSLTVPLPIRASSTGTPCEIVDLASRRLTPTLTITVPSSEELRCVSSPESVSPPTSSQQQLDSNSTDERSEDLDSSACSKARHNSSSPTAVPASLRERRRSSAAAIGAERQMPKLQRQDSKWNKVKRAFLTGASSVPPSPSRISSFFDETDAGGSYSASAEDLDNNGGVSPTVQAEIQRNYQLLHDKLSVEFYRKLTEWDKLKNGSADSQRSSQRSAVLPSSSPKDRDSANAMLMGEEQLTPEFKKKLQEWKRIKKGNPSGTTSPEHPVFRRRLTDWQIWRTPTKAEGKASDADSVGKGHLSEDFLKKMEEWKKIKSGRSDEEQSASGRRDSAEAIYQARNVQRWKTLDEKEFQPLDKVIAMIEREQQKIEKYHEKLLDKKSRLNKLSRAVGSSPIKREVLVHTPSGFYRFEGISQEFTRKLYEWEKSQGIGPESSTFQLLNPAYRAFANDATTESTREKCPKTLKRSKSMSSVVESSLRDEAPIRQPSSLSLNDVTNLENEAKLRIDSKQTIGEEEMSEELALDDSEPEAVIVDIEDVIEETASPMARFQPQQTPVYCVTASETTSIAIPLGTVTASHEPSPVILIQAGETHHRVRKHCRFSQIYDESELTEYTLSNIQSAAQVTASECSDGLGDDSRKRLFEPSEIKICETIIEEEPPSSHIGEESSSDAEASNLVKAVDRAPVESSEDSNLHENSLINTALNHDSKRTDRLSKRSGDNEVVLSRPENSGVTNNVQKNVFKTLIIQANETLQVVGNASEDANDAAKSNDIELPTRGSEEEQKETKVDDVVITVSSNVRPKKVLKTRRLTDTQVGYKWRQSTQKVEETSPEPADAPTVSTFSETPSVERIIINESTLNKIVVPTASNEQISSLAASSDNKCRDGGAEEEPYCRRLTNKSESKSVFVKTKRIIFSPFSRRNSKDKPVPCSTQKDEVEPPEPIKESNEVAETPPVRSVKSSDSPVAPAAIPTQSSSSSIQRSGSSSECPSVPCEKRPPLPQSPILQRKEYRRSSPKETAPSIRMMIQRYNQKLQEDAGSPASSGSGSPLWRSPTSERRVRTQMERYQEEVRRAIANPSGSNDLERKRLEKSASAGIIQPTRARNILKSTSADFVRNPDFVEGNKESDGSLPSSERRKNSLQNKTPEIFSNIRQCLVQDFATLPMKSDSLDDKSSSVSVTSELLEPEIPGKISPELIDKLNALSSLASQKPHNRFGGSDRSYDKHQTTASENSTPLRVRAQRIKKAKDDFLKRGPSCYSHDPSIESCRLSQGSSSSADMGSKSASAGMINVDSRTFQRLASKEKGEKSYSEVAGTLSKIASKFRRAKLKRSKEKEMKMSTVSMLCRQSLLVDIQPGDGSKSCPTSPSPQREDEDGSGFKHRDSS